MRKERIKKEREGKGERKNGCDASTPVVEHAPV